MRASLQFNHSLLCREKTLRLPCFTPTPTAVEDRVAEFPADKAWMPRGFIYVQPSEADAMYEQLRKEAGQ